MNARIGARDQAVAEEISPINIGQVYAVEFSDGWVKVGRGKRAADRVVAHQNTSRMRGAEMTRSCVSALLADCKAAERELIFWCASRGISEHGNEWFSGVDFDALSKMVSGGFEEATGEILAIAKERNDARSKRIFSVIQGGRVNQESPEALSRQAEWNSALVHAKSLEQMYLNECYGGDLFSEIPGRGCSFFFLNAALAFYQLSPMGVAELYASALEDAEECIGTIENLAAEAVAAFKEAA